MEPKPPYYVVIFSSVRTGADEQGYQEMAKRMAELAAAQPGFLGMESGHGDTHITICYWESEAAILAWKNNVEHVAAQEHGIKEWYKYYRVRIGRIDRDYGFSAEG